VLYFHPIFQFIGILLTVYALYLGSNRFRGIHLKQRVSFNWKRHVLVGKVSLGAILAGALGGMVIVRVAWHGFLVTGAHGKTGLLMIPLIIFGLVSGLHMDRVKKKRNVLPLIHGANNLILTVLCLFQIITGLAVIRNFILI